MWDFFDPNEEYLKPLIDDGYWTVEDLCKAWPSPDMERAVKAFPFGTVQLDDPAARIDYMDKLGIDVQVIYPTYQLIVEAINPLRQAAISRSYNRWLAETTSESNGRLAWAIDAPVSAMDRCLEELEFGKEHGAVAVFVRGLGHDRSLSDPSLTPMYEKAQDLDLAITIHVSGDIRKLGRARGSFLHTIVQPVPSAFWTVIVAGLPKRFPRLRWGFLEAGASWLPYVLQETFRADESGIFRSFSDWRAAAGDTLEDQQLYVAVQMDDDLPYLLDFAGENRFVHGTDFGHLDLGSDPNGLHIVANRTDIDPAVARKIVDDNARRLFGIDPAFTPAPPPTLEGLVVELPMVW
jgi:predicted TIM-barrel fold metal-dependent hydrolase